MTNTIELFSGTKSFSKVAKSKGYSTITIDNDKSLNPDYCLSIMDLNKLTFLKDIKFYILWASPPCTGFSVASIGKSWNKDGTPKSDNAKLGLILLEETIKTIKVLNPTYWYIENPRGMMRKVIDGLFKKYGVIVYRRVTITYCQYGDTRMKPTDIWTNDFEWVPIPPCNNGDSCHVSAPRGSRTGTQGIKGAKDRGVIPPGLFIDILGGKE